MCGSSKSSKSLRQTSAHDKIPGVEDFVDGLNRNRSRIGKTYVVLPSYNEASALSRLIPNILNTLNKAHRPCEVVVVNDGSSDDTSKIAAALGARELLHPANRGYGFALTTGFLWVLEHGVPEDVVLTLDADKTHDPVYIPRLIEKLEAGFDGVTASYTMPGGRAYGVPWQRRLMSSFLNKLFCVSFGLPGVRTYTNGFRAYRISALRPVRQKYGDLIIKESGFPGGTELYIKMAGLGGKTAEIPFDLHYEQRGSDSKIRLVATIRKYLSLLMKGHQYANP